MIVHIFQWPLDTKVYHFLSTIAAKNLTDDNTKYLSMMYFIGVVRPN